MKASKLTQPNSKQLNSSSRKPVPKNADKTKRFVAFCNQYRRFIQNFENIASPLNSLSKKNASFNWTNECQKAYETLRDKLISSKVLRYPDFTKRFILTTDDSNIALGAILPQGEIGNDRPISYASKSLNKHERNKSVI